METYAEVRARVDRFAADHPFGHRLHRHGPHRSRLSCLTCDVTIYAPVLPRPAETNPMVLSASRFD